MYNASANIFIKQILSTGGMINPAQHQKILRAMYSTYYNWQKQSFKGNIPTPHASSNFLTSRESGPVLERNDRAPSSCAGFFI